MERPDFLQILFLFTLLLPAFLGALIYKRSGPGFRPMILFMWTLFFLKLAQQFLKPGNSIEIAATQLEPLLSLVLICWWAKRRLVFEKTPLLYRCILIGAVVAWACELVLIIDNPQETSGFSIMSCYLIATLGIETLSRALISSRGRIYRDPVVIFSIALIFNYSFEGMLRVFAEIIEESGSGTIIGVNFLYMMGSVLTHLVYIYALLCIPKKIAYTTSFSPPSQREEA